MTEMPASRTIVQGKSTTYTATMTTKTGFSGTVAFSVTGLPAGATATFSPTTNNDHRHDHLDGGHHYLLSRGDVPPDDYGHGRKPEPIGGGYAGL